MIILRYTSQCIQRFGKSVIHLFYQVQGSDKAEFFRLVDDNIFYEDFNYKLPFIGKVDINCVYTG